mmetsp:Transcript_101229/g.281818  ORF Transcript_101229/g.281818 Transcript_101229/m.281818 type:complete len:242 (+) Transcript_101229:19-744(+)
MHWAGRDPCQRRRVDVKSGLRSGHTSSVGHHKLGGAMAVCIRPGCGRPAWKPGGFCGRSCRDRGPLSQPQAAALCVRPGCGRPAYQGKPGNFCGRSCMRAGPPTQSSSEIPDPLPMADDGQPLIAWHGTSHAFALAIQEQGFRVSADGNLGRGVYFAGERKAGRFAHDRHAAAPALVRCSIVVRKPKYVTGDDRAWQAEGFDACRSESTTLSPRPEWCILDPNQITVLEIINLTGQARPEL